jgi:hypothetical protein
MKTKKTVPSLVSVFVMILLIQPFSVASEKNPVSANVESDGDLRSEVPIEGDLLSVGDNIRESPQGWSEDIRLTNVDGFMSQDPSIAVSNLNIHVVWEDSRAGNWVSSNPGTPRVVFKDGRWCDAGTICDALFYKRSLDGGLTWDDGLGNTGQDRQLTFSGHAPIPRMTVNGPNIHIAWYEFSIGRVYYMNSTDNGRTWSEKRIISRNIESYVGGIAVSGDAVHVAINEEYAPLGPYAAFYTNSTDGGARWSTPRRISPPIYSMSVARAIAVEGDNVHILFVDDSDLDQSYDLYYVRSLDGGTTWDDGQGNVGAARTIAYGQPIDPWPAHYMPTIAVSNGRVHLAWAHEIWAPDNIPPYYAHPEYQLHYINSTDNGKTWSDWQTLSDLFGTMYYLGAPSIALRNEEVLLVWHSNITERYSEVYYKSSANGGLEWSDDLKLSNATSYCGGAEIAVTRFNIHIVWTDLSDGREIYYKRYPDFGPPPPLIVSARLEGTALENVNISWEIPRAGENESLVHHFDIYYGEIFDRNGNGYSLLDSIQASNESFHHYLHTNAGEGDPKNYFYYVCTVNLTNQFSCSNNQAGKFTRPLSEGPNLISIPLIQADESIEKVLQTLKFDKAWTYDSSGGEWTSYMSFKPYHGTLKGINHRMSTWVDVIGKCNLTVAGVVPATSSIHLQAGWNLIGYPSFNSSYTIGDFKATKGVLRVEGANSSALPYNLEILDDLDPFEAGFGYWAWVERDLWWTLNI